LKHRGGNGLGVSDFIIGLTIVAIGTSMPELAALGWFHAIHATCRQVEIPPPWSFRF
jgi:hypothetical protein